MLLGSSSQKRLGTYSHQKAVRRLKQRRAILPAAKERIAQRLHTHASLLSLEPASSTRYGLSSSGPLPDLPASENASCWRDSGSSLKIPDCRNIHFAFRLTRTRRELSGSLFPPHHDRNASSGSESSARNTRGVERRWAMTRLRVKQRCGAQNFGRYSLTISGQPNAALPG